MIYSRVTRVALGALLVASPAIASTPDGLITTKTKLELWTTAGVRSTSIHVDTNDGVVTLHGKVPTDEQRTLAEQTARSVEGVRSVNSLLQVVAAADEKRVDRSDDQTMEAAKKALKDDVMLKDSHVSVKSVDKGVVLLSGDANSLSDHLRAVAVVDRIAGVRKVASEVKAPNALQNDDRVIFLDNRATKARGMAADAPNSATDLRVTTAVKLRLLTTANIPSNEVSVDTTDGVVTLFGIVPTTVVKSAIAGEAQKVSGVKRVDNHLQIVPSSAKATVVAKDDDIARDLALAFKGRSEFDHINSAVKNGTVQLTGIVGSGWDQMSAIRTARLVAGVRGIEDKMKVQEK